MLWYIDAVMFLRFLEVLMPYLTDSMKTLLKEAAHQLKGSARRVFMARTVKELGYGGQRYAEREFGWDRGVIRKGMQELEHGTPKEDGFSHRGRKAAEEHLPHLLADNGLSRRIVDRDFRGERRPLLPRPPPAR